MIKPSAFSKGLGWLLLCAGATIAAPGCSDSAPFPEQDEPGLTQGQPTEDLAAGTNVVGEYILSVRGKERTATLRRLKPGVASRPGFNPASVDNLSIEQDGVPGSGTVNNVELNTTAVLFGAACPSGVAASFCGAVTLGSFYTHPLNNVFVQVTAITDAAGVPFTGAALAQRAAINSDGSPNGWSQSLDSSLGLWKHTGTGVNTPGVVGATAPSNLAPRIWEFGMPDPNEQTNIVLRVVATLSYTSYRMNTPSPLGVLNACTLPGAVTSRPATAGVTLPFPFTFYNTQTTTSLHFSREGVVTFGDTLPPAPATITVPGTTTTFASAVLPENPVNHSVSPGLFVFWDQLTYNSGGTAQNSAAVCRATQGTAPNRQFVITWRNMGGLNDPNNTVSLTFSAALSEGSDVIDLSYVSMLSPGGAANDVNVFPKSPTATFAQRAAGKKAIVGVQGQLHATPFPAGWNTTSTTTGSSYRFTPIP